MIQSSNLVEPKQLHGAPRLQPAMTALRATWSTRKPSNCKVSLGKTGNQNRALRGEQEEILPVTFHEILLISLLVYI